MLSSGKDTYAAERPGREIGGRVSYPLWEQQEPRREKYHPHPGTTPVSYTHLYRLLKDLEQKYIAE